MPKTRRKQDLYRPNAKPYGYRWIVGALFGAPFGGLTGSAFGSNAWIFAGILLGAVSGAMFGGLFDLLYWFLMRRVGWRAIAPPGRHSWRVPFDHPWKNMFWPHNHYGLGWLLFGLLGAVFGLIAGITEESISIIKGLLLGTLIGAAFGALTDWHLWSLGGKK